MKQFILFISISCYVHSIQAQTYPQPEFSNEVYYLKKDNVNTAVRLEKGSSKMDSKTKGAGFGGFESSYVLDGEKSSVRLPSGGNLSFIYSTASSMAASSPMRDSMLRANGMDPSMSFGGGGAMDPSSMITLYKAETSKGKRKIVMMKTGGAFGGKKSNSAEKYTFSVKKIHEGYWELVIDKTLPRGEYAFSMMSQADMDGSRIMYAFAVD